MERQQGRVLNYCVEKGYRVLKSYAEVGSGMNDNRSMLKALFRLVIAKQISRVVVEHKDRLTRFNFAFLVVFFESYGVEIEWISDTLESSYEAELVKDIISLMASMSGKVYGKRSAERRKQSSKNKQDCSTDLTPNLPEAT